MSHRIYITYEVSYPTPTATRRYTVQAGSVEQRNLLEYHDKHHAVGGIREVSYKISGGSNES